VPVDDHTAKSRPACHRWPAATAPGAWDRSPSTPPALARKLLRRAGWQGV